jgi:peptidoglycan hydrolase FlgJ
MGASAILPGAPLLAPQTSSALQTPDATEALKKVAQEFEAMMMGELLKPMFSSLDTEGLGGGGAGEAMFRPMLVDSYAKGVTDRGGLGIAQSVLAELVRMQTMTPQSAMEAANGAAR